MSLSLASALLPGCAQQPQLAVAGEPARPFDIASHVDPEYRAIAEVVMQSASKEPGLSRETLAAARAGRAGSAEVPPADQPAWSERMIPGPKDAPEVRVYIVNAGVKASARPAILHMHGGGFVVGNAKAGLRKLQELASVLDCVIISVDYRLAPETPFPGALEDNYAALKWLFDNAPGLGVDRTRLAVMGESAGGGHAAMLAIAARDRGEVPLALQALIYPMLDDRTGSTRIPPPHIGALVWKARDNRFGWTSLLGLPAGSDEVPRGAVPARVENLAGLAPAFIGVGSLDLFLQEDVDYAKRLIEADVATELHVLPGLPHGFDYVPGTLATTQFKAALQNALRRALTKPQ